ncbi:MAG: FAD-dependent oxidoreductase [Candidatus Sulfobium sp.]|jgi:pyruvate/2-oxoglutarate dehydrogenase complex dihydrolipoamide dehydrogenase (E3) component
MAGYDFDIGILGGGAAGLTVAAGAARFGGRTLLIEKWKELGGDCLHFGCVPSKTLIRTARVYHLMKNAEKFGLPRVDPKPVDYREVAKRIQYVIGLIQKHDSKERFCGLGVKVEFGDGCFVDEHSVRVNGKTYSAKNWVISSGSSPSVPPIEGLDRTPYITNKEIFSLESLPKTMITIGAGPIAIEFAQAFSRLGTKVTLIERGDQILNKEDRDMADRIMKVLAGEGMSFYLDSTTLSTRDLGGQKEVVIRNGEGQVHSLKADAILVATGRKPNIDRFGLQEISVDCDRHGLKVDSRLRTNHKHIYGAGDVTGQYLFTHAAGYEGSIVLSNSVLRLPRKVDYTNFPWVTFTDPELASIGMNEKAAKKAGIEYSVWTEEFRSNDRSLAEAEEVGKIKLLLDGKEKPLGIQILGPHAGELIGEWIAMLDGRVRLSTLASAVHPYPTLAEINKKVVGNFFSGKVFSEKVKKALKFFFGLKGRACGPEVVEDE